MGFGYSPEDHFYKLSMCPVQSTSIDECLWLIQFTLDISSLHILFMDHLSPGAHGQTTFNGGGTYQTTVLTHLCHCEHQGVPSQPSSQGQQAILQAIITCGIQQDSSALPPVVLCVHRAQVVISDQSGCSVHYLCTCVPMAYREGSSLHLR